MVSIDIELSLFLQKNIKMNPKNISINDFIYDLPEERIAKYPLQQRDESKLLVCKNGVINSSIYKDLAAEIPKKSMLVFNNTKVVEARLLFTKNTGGVIELFCLEPADSYNDITTAMLQTGKVLWKCLVGGAKKWKEDTLAKTIDGNLLFTAKKIEKKNDYFLIEFSWNNDALSFAEVLHLAGKIPLPPYLNRDAEEADKATYQTVYAKHDGSVAAPTAGLHFTDNVLQSLANKHVDTGFLTLHVGAGTFKPVKAEKMEDHDMHSEFIDVDISLIENIITKIKEKNNIIAVGTTSLRTLESLYWMGVKTKYEVRSSKYDLEKSKVKSQKEEIEKQNNSTTINTKQQTLNIELNQWDCYELPQNIEPFIALESLLIWMKENNLKKLLSKTQIIIAPGYQLRIADALITNFHQPKSTLLLLISAVIGDDWKQVYNYALENNFRFLSYGDGSLLWRSNV
jgi:S-adenosylmethionine:tRNA ribosyltransferase-isomerase